MGALSDLCSTFGYAFSYPKVEHLCSTFGYAFSYPKVEHKTLAELAKKVCECSEKMRILIIFMYQKWVRKIELKMYFHVPIFGTKMRTRNGYAKLN